MSKSSDQRQLTLVTEKGWEIKNIVQSALTCKTYVLARHIRAQVMRKSWLHLTQEAPTSANLLIAKTTKLILTKEIFCHIQHTMNKTQIGKDRTHHMSCSGPH